MFKRIMSWWNARRRAIDLDVLWPACKTHTRSLDHAKATFALHAFNDPAWLCLGEDEIRRQIERLV